MDVTLILGRRATHRSNRCLLSSPIYSPSAPREPRSRGCLIPLLTARLGEALSLAFTVSPVRNAWGRWPHAPGSLTKHRPARIQQGSLSTGPSRHYLLSTGSKLIPIPCWLLSKAWQFHVTVSERICNWLLQRTFVCRSSSLSTNCCQGSKPLCKAADCIKQWYYPI